MKFEKEILRDYELLVSYAKQIKFRYKQRLKSNVATGIETDFVNDAIIDFYNSPPEVYDIKILERSIARHMSYEDKNMAKHVSFDNTELFNPSSIKKLQDPKSFASSALGFSEKILQSTPVASTDECNYFILNDGRCVSHMQSNNRFKILKPLKKADGYIQYHFGKKIKYAHRLVYKKYGGGIPKNMEIHHIDHDKSNNHIDNLMLVSRSTNLSFYHNTYCKLKKKKERSNKLGAPNGDKHGKFKGYYVINGVAYESSYIAQQETGINYRTVQRRCKSNQDGYLFIEI